jgi:hypothetical protein
MTIRIAILAACASALALGFGAITDTFAKDEKTFLDGNASFGKAKEGKKDAGGKREAIREGGKTKSDKPLDPGVIGGARIRF